MSASFFIVARTLLFVLVGAFLSGCSSSSVNTTRFYILNPLDAGINLVKKADRKDPLSVEVASLRLPQYLERPQIVTRSGVNRLELAEFHQWGGNLQKNMARVLAKNLSQLLDTPDIIISPNRPLAPPDFRVELEVLRFERDSDGRVRLSAQWRLTSGKNRISLATKITGLASTPIENRSDFDQTVLAMSILFGKLSKIIGQEILKHKL